MIIFRKLTNILLKGCSLVVDASKKQNYKGPRVWYPRPPALGSYFSLWFYSCMPLCDEPSQIIKVSTSIAGKVNTVARKQVL